MYPGCQREHIMKNPIHHLPCFELLDLGTEVSSFLTVLMDFALIVLYLLALPLQLVNEVVLDHRESSCRVVCQCLHHYDRS